MRQNHAVRIKIYSKKTQYGVCLFPDTGPWRHIVLCTRNQSGLATPTQHVVRHLVVTFGISTDLSWVGRQKNLFYVSFGTPAFGMAVGWSSCYAAMAAWSPECPNLLWLAEGEFAKQISTTALALLSAKYLALLCRLMSAWPWLLSSFTYDDPLHMLNNFCFHV